MLLQRSSSRYGQDGEYRRGRVYCLSAGKIPALLRQQSEPREDESLAVHRQWGAMVLAGAVIGAGALFAQSGTGPAPAHAAAPIMTCKEAGNVTWLGPGLVAWLGPGIAGTAATADWTATVLYSDCSGSAVETGKPYPTHMVLNGTEKMQCEGPTTDHKGTGELTWSDGTTSTIREDQVSATMSGGSGKGEFAVAVVSGTFEGHEIVEETALMFSGGLCPGVTTATFTGAFTMF